MSTFVKGIKEYGQFVDLQSSSTRFIAVDKLPQVPEEKCLLYVDDKFEDSPDLIMFDRWLSKMAFVHEGFSAFKGEGRDFECEGDEANAKQSFSAS